MSFAETFGKMLMILFAIAMGYLANRLRIFDAESDRKLTKLVLNITIPCMILASVMTGEALPELGTVLSVWKMMAVFYAVEVVFVLAVPPVLGGSAAQKGVWRFSLFFPNAMFIGYPVLEALFGESAIFYAVMLTLPFNVLSYSVGPLMLGGFRRFSRRSLCTPCMISSVLSLLIVMLGIQVPPMAGRVLDFVGDLTAPLSLLVLGSILAGMPVGKVLTMPRIWIFAAFRLVIMAGAALLILNCMGLDPVVMGVGVVVMAMPAAVNGVMICMEYGGDSECMAQTIFVTTLLSIVTIPLIAMLL